jgi:putative Mn2+ efflux pump MntP
MNIFQILLSGLAMSLAGVAISMTFATVNQPTVNQANFNPKVPAHYIALGAVIGLAVGCGQEAIRELATEETD